MSKKISAMDKKFLIHATVICYEYLFKFHSLDLFEYGIEGDLVVYRDWISAPLKNYMQDFVGNLEIDRYMYDFNDESEEVERRANELLKYTKELLNMNDDTNLTNKIKNKLLLFLAEVVNRKEVSDWAIEEFSKNEDASELEKKYLIKLAAIDLMDQKTQSYVDSEEEIVQWLIELD